MPVYSCTVSRLPLLSFQRTLFVLINLVPHVGNPLLGRDCRTHCLRFCWQKGMSVNHSKRDWSGNYLDCLEEEGCSLCKQGERDRGPRESRDTQTRAEGWGDVHHNWPEGRLSMFFAKRLIK